MRLLPLSGKAIEYSSRPGLRLYRLLKSMVLVDQDTGAIYGIPHDFECDGATIPFFLPETGPCEAGGFAHDFAYRFAFVYRWNNANSSWHFEWVTRAWADKFYAAVCVAYGGYAAWAQIQRGALRAWPRTWWIWSRHRARDLRWSGPLPTVCFGPAPGGAS